MKKTNIITGSSTKRHLSLQKKEALNFEIQLSNFVH